MLPSFTQKYTDESTDDEFVFSFYCDLCDNSWKSIPISFSQANQKGFWKSLFISLSTLRKIEHKDAFERANREGMFYFNRCPACKRWVCDRHFFEEEDQCSSCYVSQREGALK